MAAVLDDILERAFHQAAAGDDEATSGVYDDVMRTWVYDCRAELGVEVADSSNFHIWQKPFDVTIAAGGEASLNDANLTGLLRQFIRHVDHVAVDNVTVTRMRRVSDPQVFDLLNQRGWMWWVLRDGKVQSIDPGGRRTPQSVLTGKFRLHASYVPELADFDNFPVLQSRLVAKIAAYARAKLVPRFAMALDEARAAIAEKTA